LRRHPIPSAIDLLEQEDERAIACGQTPDKSDDVRVANGDIPAHDGHRVVGRRVKSR